jgi:hypothetical protein
MNSIFQNYFANSPLVDKYITDNSRAVDVIIPIINTNELWYTNLLSFYREIPIQNLIIGDGGSTDNSIQILESFPRVKLVKQYDFISQGYAIKELINHVESDFFIYLHADVFLPENWFDHMYYYKNTYDWFECFRRMTVLFEYPSHAQHLSERAFSGSQFGKTNFVKKAIENIADDYLQRNEDIIIMELVRQNGGKYAKIDDTFHYHQIMNKRGEKEPKIEYVEIEKEKNIEWENRIFEMQYKGIIKYLDPKPYLIVNVFYSIRILSRNNAFDWKKFKIWVHENNLTWENKINKYKFEIYKLKVVSRKIFSILANETLIGMRINVLRKKIC